MIKFTNTCEWVLRNGEVLAHDRCLVVTKTEKIEIKWGLDKKIAERRPVAEGEKFRDIEKLNEETPREQWVKKLDGKGLKGPWEAQLVVHLIDDSTMDRFWYPTSTVGGKIAIRDLKQKIAWMRRLRGQNVYPVVLLRNTYMSTGYGGRQRPHFIIVRFVKMGIGVEEALPELPSPTTASGPAMIEAKPVAARQVLDQVTGQAQAIETVEPPSLQEDLGDSVPF
jgi:hypothetical protein